LGKRRFTDFVFQRLRANEPAHPLPEAQPSYNAPIQERSRSASSHAAGGAPVVQPTSPGAEFRDALQRKAVRAQLLQQQKDNLSSGDGEAQVMVEDDSSHRSIADSAQPTLPLAARRFHLSRNNLTPASSKHLAGIWKHKHHNRPHLATFVEKNVGRLSDGELQSFNKRSPIDRLIDDANFNPLAVSELHESSPDKSRNGASTMVGYSPTHIQSFVKPPVEFAKTGNSIRDHPSTWDHDSDQLANELAAFALEISQEGKGGKQNQEKMDAPGRRTPEIVDTDMDVDDIYVYETYLRVRQSELSLHHEGKTNSIGMLVIEQQDEELWQTFAEDEEDSEWDEEDADSNGMSIARLGINPPDIYSGGQPSERLPGGRSQLRRRIWSQLVQV
jgi:hypothetical protein